MKTLAEKRAIAKRHREARDRMTPLEQLIKIVNDPTRGRCTREIKRLLEQIRDFAELVPGGIEATNKRLAECKIDLRVEPRKDGKCNPLNHLTKK
mgnify:CR=1 FL=1